MAPAVLALDVGTSVVKAAVVSADGLVRSVVSAPAPQAPAGTADQEESWLACAEVLRRAVAGHPGDVHAVVVTGQGDGLWTVERGGRAGQAVLWNSVAAAPVVAGWEADGTVAEHYRRTGTVLWPGTSAAAWRWLRQTDPRRAARVTAVVAAKDWIGYRLTGEVSTDLTDGTIPFLDPRTRTLDPGLFELLGCQELAGLVPVPRDPGEVLGAVTSAAAELTGIPRGTPVVLGCLDVAAVVRGAGSREVGDAVAVLGTTTAALPLTAEPVPDADPAGATIAWPERGRYLRVLGSSSGTGVLEWFLRTHRYQGEDRYEQFWADVATAEGSTEMMLPFLYGERSPFLAPGATGTFVGLTASTGRPELARAVIESITMALRHCLDSAGRTSTIVLTGGGAGDRRWCQLVADVTGRQVLVDDRPDLACLGAASLVPGFADAAAGGAARRAVDPSGRTEELEAGYRRYLDLIGRMLPVWKENES